MTTLTQDRVLELLKYSPTTGVFKWKGTRGHMKRGAVAGNINGNGYIHISIDGKLYQATRLVWLYEFGYFPEHIIKHANRLPGDNRLSNLSEQTQFCNTQKKSTNTSGVVGVTWSKKANKWYASITIKGKKKHLGSFTDIKEAAEVRKRAEDVVLNGSSCEI